MAGKNPIGWFEIHVKDFDKARDFYGKLFSWEFNLSQGSKSQYWNIFTAEGSIGGGFMKKSKPEHEGQAVLIYVEVEDIEATLNKAAELGGKTQTPKTLINEKAGYFALFYDNDNNLIGLWSKN
jgi:hypothetical protein